MRRRLWLFGLFTVSLLFFAGCDGDGDDAAAEPAAEPETPSVNVTGTWVGTLDGSFDLVLELTQTGTNVVGTGTDQNNDIFNYTGTIAGNHLSLAYANGGMELTVNGNDMVGVFNGGSFVNVVAQFNRP